MPIRRHIYWRSASPQIFSNAARPANSGFGGRSMKAGFGLWIASLGLFAVAAPVFAHHSFAAEYDNAKPIALTGTVTKVEWMNPHARFYINVKDDKGAVTNWEFELGSPNALMRLGWTRNS